MVVVRLNCRFRKPARYDDVLRLVTRIKKIGAAKLEHEYFLYRGHELLTEAESLLACVNSAGEPQLLPDEFRGGTD